MIVDRNCEGGIVVQENKNTDKKETETLKKCPHINVESWNHGYHSICKDCGEKDIW